MDFGRSLPQATYVPQLSGGRRRFRGLPSADGYAYSLRENTPDLVCRPLSTLPGGCGRTSEKILGLAETLDAFASTWTPLQRMTLATGIGRRSRQIAGTSASSWYPDQSSGSAPLPAPAAGHAACRPDGRFAGGLSGRSCRTVLALSHRDSAGADDLFDSGYQPGGTQPPVFKTEHAAPKCTC